MRAELAWLQSGQDFPSPENALDEPNGLLAAGGDLQPTTLISAYRRGIFPWYSEGQPPLWWSPDPRALLLPGQVHISRSLTKLIRHRNYRVTTDRHFSRVIEACGQHRREGTWILPEISDAYKALHQLGFAHSVEVYIGDDLVGGLYGVAIGNIFCGESMFSVQTNASKVAFVTTALVLFRAGFQAIDCQLENPHLARLGVKAVPRKTFLTLLEDGRDQGLDWPPINLAPATLLDYLD